MPKHWRSSKGMVAMSRTNHPLAGKNINIKEAKREQQQQHVVGARITTKENGAQSLPQSHQRHAPSLAMLSPEGQLLQRPDIYD